MIDIDRPKGTSTAADLDVDLLNRCHAPVVSTWGRGSRRRSKLPRRSRRATGSRFDTRDRLGASRGPLRCRVGRHRGLYNGTFLDVGPDGAAEIGDYCAIVGAISACDRPVLIQDYAFVAHEVTIADTAYAVPGGDVDGTTDKSPIVVEENAWIGARAVLLAGAHVGRDAVVGAGTAVDFAVPPDTVVAGNPPRVRTPPAPGG